MKLTEEEKTWLLKLAREVLEASAQGNEVELDREIPAKTKERCGCFVTLHKHGELRGCIGSIYPLQPLYLDVRDNAKNASQSDPRFDPVSSDEVKDLSIEISVLSVPQPLSFSSPEKLVKALQSKPGVILMDRGFSATFLPQVWEQLQKPEDFLAQLCQKAGLPVDAWKTSKTMRIETYTAEVFSEKH
jgi:AmmeMemoRadiSam system protein A